MKTGWLFMVNKQIHTDQCVNQTRGGWTCIFGVFNCVFEYNCAADWIYSPRK